VLYVVFLEKGPRKVSEKDQEIWLQVKSQRIRYRGEKGKHKFINKDPNENFSICAKCLRLLELRNEDKIT